MHRRAVHTCAFTPLKRRMAGSSPRAAACALHACATCGQVSAGQPGAVAEAAQQCGVAGAFIWQQDTKLENWFKQSGACLLILHGTQRVQGMVGHGSPSQGALAPTRRRQQP